jgi:membrane-bound ClpP family serine protease
MTTLSRCGAIARAFCLAAIVGAVFAAPAYAYLGPGTGLTAIGTVLALIAAVFLAIVGFVWYPVKRLVRSRRARALKNAAAGAELTIQSNETRVV